MMSAVGQSRLAGPMPSMSVKVRKADPWERANKVSEVPLAEVTRPSLRKSRLAQTIEHVIKIGLKLVRLGLSPDVQGERRLQPERIGS